MLETETGATISVKVTSTYPSSALYDIDITAQPSNTAACIPTTASISNFRGVSATLISPTTLSATLAGALTRATVISQPHGAAGAERLHIFSGRHAVTILRRAPAWVEVFSADARLAARGALRAPMPSLVVEVRVAVGEHVEKGQVVVVLESMKTETVLRAPAGGVVKAVGCVKGEMVEEGRELVDIVESEE
jgi:3-methylcrotonyl-CoA carboxylase alpha subunit